MHRNAIHRNVFKKDFFLDFFCIRRYNLNCGKRKGSLWLLFNTSFTMFWREKKLLRIELLNNTCVCSLLLSLVTICTLYVVFIHTFIKLKLCDSERNWHLKLFSDWRWLCRGTTFVLPSSFFVFLFSILSSTTWDRRKQPGIMESPKWLVDRLLQ